MSIHDILTTVAALAAVILMILLIRFGSRFIDVIPRRTANHGTLTLEASLSLDPKRKLRLIGCQGRQLLLLTGGHSDLFLGWLPPITPPTGDSL